MAATVAPTRNPWTEEKVNRTRGERQRANFFYFLWSAARREWKRLSQMEMYLFGCVRAFVCVCVYARTNSSFLYIFIINTHTHRSILHRSISFYYIFGWFHYISFFLLFVYFLNLLFCWELLEMLPSSCVYITYISLYFMSILKPYILFSTFLEYLWFVHSLILVGQL